MSKLVLDLHDIFNNSKAIEQALKESVEEALSCRHKELEIIPGKGSGQLKKRVLRFLDRPEIKSLYHRIDKDSKNFGKIHIYFRY